MADKDQDFVAFCLECLHGPWKQRAEEAYEEFRAKMPMKQIMEHLLDSTVSKSPTELPKLSASDDGERKRLQFRAADEPQLLGDWEGYNFVRYAQRIYALHQGIGEVDLAVEAHSLISRHGANAVIVAETIEEARAAVKKRSDEALKKES
jgi:hypothetical protein